MQTNERVNYNVLKALGANFSVCIDMKGPIRKGKHIYELSLRRE